jgi:hypothetical protein
MRRSERLFDHLASSPGVASATVIRIIDVLFTIGEAPDVFEPRTSGVMLCHISIKPASEFCRMTNST